MNLNPTHIVLNFGLWMTGALRGCGHSPGQRCPYWPEFCEFLNGEHPFKVIWQTTTPKWSTGDTIIDTHLHVPHVCKLDPSMVVHRGLVFKALSETLDQWTPLFHDDLHFAPPAYHAFNGALIDMIGGGAARDEDQSTATQLTDEDIQQGLLIAELDS